MAQFPRPIPQRPAPSPSRLAVHEEAEVSDTNWQDADGRCWYRCHICSHAQHVGELCKCAWTDSDPTGRSAHDPGAKLDSGKPRAGLMLADFPRALAALAAVTTYGAAKYSESGWVSVPDGEKRYRDALMRHLLSAQREECDAESGLSHMAHAAWNICALIELRERAK